MNTLKQFKKNLKLQTSANTLVCTIKLTISRDVCIKIYNLDPAWYYTSPGLAWDAMLKITRVKLELLSDVNMLRLIQNGIRGGITMVSNCFGQANNKHNG